MKRSGGEDENLGTVLGLGLGLGFGLGIVFLARYPSLTLTLKPISTAIKIADGAIRAARSLHSPSPQTLILASKALTKGFRAIKRRRTRSPNPALKTLRSYIATANLVRLARYETLELGFLGGGYKLSKNLARLLEGIVGLQLDSAVRHGISALGLAAKVTAIVTEVCRRGRRQNRLGFRSGVRWSGGSGIGLRFKRLNLDGNLRGLRSGNCNSGGGGGGDDALVVSNPSELLCLAIPVCCDMLAQYDSCKGRH